MYAFMHICARTHTHTLSLFLSLFHSVFGMWTGNILNWTFPVWKLTVCPTSYTCWEFCCFSFIRWIWHHPSVSASRAISLVSVYVWLLQGSRKSAKRTYVGGCPSYSEEKITRTGHSYCDGWCHVQGGWPDHTWHCNKNMDCVYW